jgi:glycosyltransferase involved in cell wall biosynthesis
MKILLCHNYYRCPGGEDQVFADEAALLESRGHEVIRYTVHNDLIAGMAPWDTARKTIWNGESYRGLRRLLRQDRPDVMHCTNLFPLISPSAYYAARAEGVPVVQSLHNYRALCLSGALMRNGKVCEECLTKAVPWPGVVWGCYRGSRAASAVVATMLTIHRALRTWTRTVARFIAMSDFSRRKLIAGGLPAGRLVVKPNFVAPDPGAGRGSGGYAVFAGRLSVEKGLDVLLNAWDRLDGALPLKIIGDGPLAGQVRAAAHRNPAIEYLGRRPLPEVLSTVGDAACTVICSTCYENCPKTVLESYVKGTPVIAPRFGAMEELVEDGGTGCQFEPGNAADLAAKVRTLTADPSRLAGMRRAARREYETKYTADRNYGLLMSVYRAVTEEPAKDRRRDKRHLLLHERAPLSPNEGRRRGIGDSSVLTAARIGAPQEDE